MLAILPDTAKGIAMSSDSGVPKNTEHVPMSYMQKLWDMSDYYDKPVGDKTPAPIGSGNADLLLKGEKRA